MENSYAIELKNLTKNYGKFKALNDMSMKLGKNKIYGLLGRNGAGKTTILNILSARLFPTSGETCVFGNNAYENINTLRQICYIEEKGFYANSIKVSDVLKLSSGLYPNWDNDYANRLLRIFELNPKKKYKQLSRGMESSLGLIIGLASRAPLTIFDEPSLGLDAVIRERFYDQVIEDFSNNPRTIIISTHLIDEVSRIFEDIVIVDKGQILLQSEVTKLNEKAFFVSGTEEAVKRATSDAIILNKETFGSTFILSVYAENGINSSDVEVQPMPLQKLFVNLINSENKNLIRKVGITQ